MPFGHRHDEGGRDQRAPRYGNKKSEESSTQHGFGIARAVTILQLPVLLFHLGGGHGEQNSRPTAGRIHARPDECCFVRHCFCYSLHFSYVAPTVSLAGAICLPLAWNPARSIRYSAILAETLRRDRPLILAVCSTLP